MPPPEGISRESPIAFYFPCPGLHCPLVCVYGTACQMRVCGDSSLWGREAPILELFAVQLGGGEVMFKTPPTQFRLKLLRFTRHKRLFTGVPDCRLSNNAILLGSKFLAAVPLRPERNRSRVYLISLPLCCLVSSNPRTPSSYSCLTLCSKGSGIAAGQARTRTSGPSRFGACNTRGGPPASTCLTLLSLLRAEPPVSKQEGGSSGQRGRWG